MKSIHSKALASNYFPSSSRLVSAFAVCCAVNSAQHMTRHDIKDKREIVVKIGVKERKEKERTSIQLLFHSAAATAVAVVCGEMHSLFIFSCL